MSVQLTLIALAITPVLAYMAYRYSRVSHPVLKEVQQRVADVTTRAEENVVGVRVVKAFAPGAERVGPVPGRVASGSSARRCARPACRPPTCRR